MAVKLRKCPKAGRQAVRKVRRMSKGGATGGKKYAYEKGGRGGKMTVAQLRSAAKKWV